MDSDDGFWCRGGGDIVIGTNDCDPSRLLTCVKDSPGSASESVSVPDSGVGKEEDVETLGGRVDGGEDDVKGRSSEVNLNELGRVPPASPAEPRAPPMSLLAPGLEGGLLVLETVVSTSFLDCACDLGSAARAAATAPRT